MDEGKSAVDAISSSGIEITDWVAIFIAALALIGSFWQLHLTRQHNKLSVRPSITLGWHTSYQKHGVWIKNAGLGPAEIKSICFRFGDNTTTQQEIQRKLRDEGFECGVNTVEAGTVIQADQQGWLFKTDTPIEDKSRAIAFWEILSQVQVAIKYHSFYKEKTLDKCYNIPNPIAEKLVVFESKEQESGI